VNDPAGAIHWQGPKLVDAQGFADRWSYVGRYAAHLAREAEADEPTVEMYLEAVLGTVKETETELLRGDHSRSTSPYANAVEDDLRKAKADWLRDHTVAMAKSAAKGIGVTLEDQ